MGKFPGWRTMTAAQRYNAKMEAMFADARSRGHTGLHPGTEKVAARDVKRGDILEGYGRIDVVDVSENSVQIGYEADGGNWGDFAPDHLFTRAAA